MQTPGWIKGERLVISASQTELQDIEVDIDPTPFPLPGMASCSKGSLGRKWRGSSSTSSRWS